MSKRKKPKANLRPIDQETARVVAVLDSEKTYVGAGCLIDGSFILTCYHVVVCALGKKRPKKGLKVTVKLVGIDGRLVKAKIRKWGRYTGRGKSVDDLALLELVRTFDIPEAEFATPLRHCGKRYSVLGFPDGDPQGRNAGGILHAANADGLVQMDGNSALFVKGGFSGAPVWSSDLKAFVGIVVRELSDSGVAWCIPSRILCRFYPKLAVRFRVTLPDRPEIHDREEDDPNVQLFGVSSDNGERALTGRVIWDKAGGYGVKVIYQILKGPSRPRGKYVTFITYPDFREEGEDAYELFSKVEKGRAWTQVYPEDDLFTIAAIGDAGDTALTLDLNRCLEGRP